MTRSRWIIFVAIVVAVLGGLVGLSNKDRVDVKNVDVNALVKDGDNADHIYGNPNAKVVVVEYADFQCPGCGSAYPNVTSIKEQYKDQVAFVFRHFPLTSIHPNALAAAAAAEAAGLQGKFWQMHDLLFQSQSSWENLKAEERGSAFEQYASQVGLNLEQFKTDLGSEKVSKKIAYDRAVAGKAKVNSTPTFFINGELVTSDVTTELIQKDAAQFKTALNNAIKSTGGIVPSAKTE